MWRRLFHVAPLLAVLTLQAALSIRLVWANTAYTDEALYLWAGRLQWAHWLHGAPIPHFAAYFSGAPIIYPPIGALADGIGGLAAARLLSLFFMLATTTFLWLTAERLYGRRAALFATAVFAVLGPTIHLGAFATYDAMALSLLAMSAWFAVHSAPKWDQMRWVAAAAIALALANATKYATALFDPVVITLAILNAWPATEEKKNAYIRGAALASYVTAGLIMLLTVGGGYYMTGIEQTTLTRTLGDNPPSVVLHDSWGWIGVVVTLSIAAAIAMLARERGISHHTLQAATLAGAALLVPIEQARIHTTTSLDKHVDFGAWFAAVAAGYVIATIARLMRPTFARSTATLALTALVASTAVVGVRQAYQMNQWPNSYNFVTALRPVVDKTSGQILIDDTAIPKYYIPTPWQRWSTTSSITLPSGRSLSVAVGRLGDPAIYEHYLRSGYFSVVVLNFTKPGTLNSAIISFLSHDPSYRLLETIPYGRDHYGVWKYEKNSGAA